MPRITLGRFLKNLRMHGTVPELPIFLRLRGRDGSGVGDGMGRHVMLETGTPLVCDGRPDSFVFDYSWDSTGCARTARVGDVISWMANVSDGDGLADLPVVFAGDAGRFYPEDADAYLCEPTGFADEPMALLVTATA